MEIGRLGAKHWELRFSRDELEILNNALNEVCNGVADLDDDSEFHTRMGVTRSEARALLTEFHELLKGPGAGHA